MITIPFKRRLGRLEFSDALHLEDDHGLTKAEIEAMMDQRFANWLDVVLPPAEATEPLSEVPAPLED